MANKLGKNTHKTKTKQERCKLCSRGFSGEKVRLAKCSPKRYRQDSFHHSRSGTNSNLRRGLETRKSPGRARRPEQRIRVSRAQRYLGGGRATTRLGYGKARGFCAAPNTCGLPLPGPSPLLGDRGMLALVDAKAGHVTKPVAN